MKNILTHAISAWLSNQISLKMKLSIFLITALLFQAQAYTLYGQQEKVTVHLQNVTIGQVIDKIENETSFLFIYRTNEVDTNRIISINIRNGTIEQVLKNIFDNTSTKWSIDGKQIILTRKKADMPKAGNTESDTVSTLITPPTENEQEPVTGTVSDAGGPMPGVVVSVKGKNISTITDDFGYFSIEANPGDILVFSYPGYDSIEAAVGTRTSFAIELQESVTELENAVINAGYYTVRDRERTGSISRITAKEIEDQPVNTVLDAMQGRMAGVDIIPTTGLAGGGYEIRVRGQNSIAAGNEPLYVIDGVPFDMGSLGSEYVSIGILPGATISPLNTLDPAIIKSIEVLKDADATAIYGSRGANGVILITTKQGESGKTVFSVEASSSVTSVTRFPKLLNTEQYLAMRREAFANDGISEYPENAYDVNGTWDQNRYTDWQKEFMGNTAYNNTARVSVSGGNTNTSFIIGGSFTKETTVFPMNFNYKRTAAFANIRHESKDKRFKIQFSSNYGTDSNLLPADDLTRIARILPPNAPALYDEDGNLNWENNTWDNPLAPLEATYRNYSNNFIVNTTLSYELFKGLKFKTNFGYNRSNLLERQLKPSTMYNPSWGVTSASSISNKNEGNRNFWIIEPQLDASYKLGSGRLDITVGTTLQEQNVEQTAMFAFGFPNNSFLTDFSAAQNVEYLNQSTLQYRYIALYGRINYTWNHKYIINLTGRRDGSSRFGPGKQFANFGAVGAAWIFSNESILKNASWLSFGKLRGSFGITGNDQIGDYQYLNTYTVTDGDYQGNIGLNPTRLFNPNFAWEENRKLEAAIEFGLFRDRINFNVAWYKNRSDNQLIGVPLPGTTGFTSINANLNATIENSGWEFNLQTKNFKNSDFTWSTSFLLTLPKNKLVAFDGLENSTYANQLVIGMPLSVYRLYKLKGVNPETGLFEFEDFNGDGVISVEDRQYNADLTPKYYGSIANTITYKNWSLDFMFQFVKKKAFNEYFGTSLPGMMINQPVGVLDHWQNPGDETFMQGYSTQNFDAFIAYSRFSTSNGSVSDGSFARLKSLSISYKVPLSNENQSSCTLYIQGYNLWTITKFTAGDPEQPLSFMPPLKRISFGVRLNF